jgi:hypothetical protein
VGWPCHPPAGSRLLPPAQRAVAQRLSALVRCGRHGKPRSLARQRKHSTFAVLVRSPQSTRQRPREGRWCEFRSRAIGLEEAFHSKAVLQKETAAGALLVKINERRSTLLGLNPPQGHAVQIVQHAPADAPSSFDRIRAALDRVRAQHKPEGDGPLPGLEPSRSNGGSEEEKSN